MPVHDWTRVDAGIFHDFHTAWITELRNVLNNGQLPDGYYALTEQHAGRTVPDVLTLQVSPPRPEGISSLSPGGLAVADAPPRVDRKLTAIGSLRAKRRSLAIRHVSGHRLIALIEIVSPSNKDRRGHVDDLASKVVSALELGVHVLLIDVFPPGQFDPRGMHGAVWSMLDEPEEPESLRPLGQVTLASYAAGEPVDAYLAHVAIGSMLPDMPLFLQVERYIDVPLEPTYQAAFGGEPQFWREILERIEFLSEQLAATVTGRGGRVLVITSVGTPSRPACQSRRRASPERYWAPEPPRLVLPR